MSAYRIALAGQDITAKVDEPTIQIQNSLAGGAGVMSHTSGRAGIAQFEAYMGPLATAPGNGQFVPPPAANLLTANQSNIENGTTGFASSGTGSVLSVDTAQAQQGTHSLKAVVDGTVNFQGWEIDMPGSQLQTNTVYTLSAYVYGDTGGKQLSLEVKQKESPFAFYANTKFVGANSWQRVSVTFTTPATPPSNFQLHLITEDTAAFATTFWTDAIQLEAGMTPGPWVVGGTEGAGSTLVRQGEVKIYDSNNNRIFGGYLTHTDDRTKKLTVKTLCKCVDYWSHLDRIVVTKTYDGVSDTFALSDLLTTYAPWIGLSNVNLSVSNITLYQQVYRGKSLQAALQHIADITGFDIWVDEYKNLYYQAPSKDGNAPFSISDSPDGITSFRALITQHSLDDNATINRVTFVGGQHPTTDFTQDVSSQANGNNTTFKLAYAPHESSDGKIHVTVAGVQQVVGYALTTDQLKKDGGLCDVLVDRSQATLTFNTAPASGAQVLCTYRYQTPLVVVVTNQQSQAFFGQWFDGTIADSTVQDTATALQRCRTLLAEQAQGLEMLQFQTYQPGLQAGMRILVQNAVRGINTTFRIQQVNTVWLGGGQFRYDVQAGAWNWHVADILLAAARFSQEADSNFDELNVSILVASGVSNMGVHDLWRISQQVSGYYYARMAKVGDGHDAFPGFFTVSSPLPALGQGGGNLGGNLFAGSGTLIARGGAYIIGQATIGGVGNIPAPSGHVV